MDAITLPAGTLVKVDGLPFGLLHDTPVDGNKANLPLIRQESATSGPAEELGHADATSSANSLQ